MASEARNRDENIKSAITYPNFVWDMLKYEYGMRSKLWKTALLDSRKWTGIPGLRSIGLGRSRSTVLGGKTINKIGVNLVNRPLGALIKKYGFNESIRDFGSNFAEKGIGQNVAGRFLGGHIGSPLLNVPEGSKEAVMKAMGTDWWGALRGKVTSAREQAFSKGIYKAPGKYKFFAGMKGTKAAWKYAVTQKFAPAAIWASNLAFAASLVTPIFSAAGRYVAGELESIENFAKSLNRRDLDFGGKIHQSYMNKAGLTERQRALRELQSSRTNARTLIGNEGALYHS